MSQVFERNAQSQARHKHARGEVQTFAQAVDRRRRIAGQHLRFAKPMPQGRIFRLRMVCRERHVGCALRMALMQLTRGDELQRLDVIGQIVQ
ncbi:MAG: hypothetical protein ABI767_13130 [Rhodanobacter sp.]